MVLLNLQSTIFGTPNFYDLVTNETVKSAEYFSTYCQNWPRIFKPIFLCFLMVKKCDKIRWILEAKTFYKDKSKFMRILSVLKHAKVFSTSVWDLLYFTASTTQSNSVLFLSNRRNSAAGGATSSATPTFNKVWQNFLTTRLWPPRGPKKPPAASSAALKEIRISKRPRFFLLKMSLEMHHRIN